MKKETCKIGNISLKSYSFHYLPELFLIIIIPLFIMGFNFFEDSFLYRSIFNFNEIENVIYNRFSTQLGDGDRKMLSVEKSGEVEELESIWKLVKKI